MKLLNVGIRLKVAAALSACVVLALGGSLAVASLVSERALRSEVSDRLTRAVESELNAVERYLARAMDDLVTVSENVAMQDVLIADDLGEIDVTLAAYRSRYLEFSGLIVADEAGIVVAADGADIAPGTVTDLPEFAESMRGVANSSTFGAHPAIAGESLVMSVPIHADYDPDTIIGVLLGIPDLDAFRQRLASVEVADSPQARDQILLLTSGEPARQIYVTDAIGAAAAMSPAMNATGTSEKDRLPDSTGAYLVSSAAAPVGSAFAHLDLRIYSAVSKEVAFASVSRLKRDLARTAALMGLGMLPLGWFGARTLTRPLTAVTAAMAHIAANSEGPEARNAPVAGRIPTDVLNRKDEIGTLGRTFAMLMEQLSEARAILIKQSNAEIAKRSQRLDAALNNMSQGLCMFDQDHRLIVSNRRFEEIFSLSREAVSPGRPIEEVFRSACATGNYPGINPEHLAAQARDRVATGRAHMFNEVLSEARTVAVSEVPMREGGWVVTYEDITERRRSEALMEHMAHHDELTGLANRTMFRGELDKALAALPQDATLAVFCLDLDGFKAVNDTLGHPTGDQLLKAVADRLSGCIRKEDVVARLGGDEFAVLRRRIDGEDSATAFAERLLTALSAPYALDSHQVVVGASAGIAFAPENGQTADALIKGADMALYRAKSDGRGTFCFFEAEMDARLQERRALEIDLRSALGNGEFHVVYQPIMNLERGEVACLEALLRWRHPERGMVRPDVFIPLAEETGLIGQIGAWVLDRACLDAASWPESVRVAVNLSPVQLRSLAFVFDVDAALDRSGLAPNRLELEITESVLLSQTELTLEILNKLRTMGVRISMDDFGTGYSSLSYLRRFPFDKIKIDQSFIRDLAGDMGAGAIVRAITALGDSLGMTTTAEGVETMAQLEKLRLEGCTEVQGFLYSPGVSAQSIPSLLAALAASRASDAA